MSADTIFQALTQLQAAAIVEPKHYSFMEMSQRIPKIILFSRATTKDGHNIFIKISKLVLGYFILYSVLGFLLHCNFFPWT